MVHVFILKEGNFIAKNYGDDAMITSHVLQDCTIDLAQVFEPLPMIEKNI